MHAFRFVLACRDTDVRCPGWKIRYCSKNRYVDRNCKKTCGTCGGKFDSYKTLINNLNTILGIKLVKRSLCQTIMHIKTLCTNTNLKLEELTWQKFFFFLSFFYPIRQLNKS